MRFSAICEYLVLNRLQNYKKIFKYTNVNVIFYEIFLYICEYSRFHRNNHKCNQYERGTIMGLKNNHAGIYNRID